MVVIETQQTIVSPTAGLNGHDWQGKAGRRGRLFAQQMTSLKYSHILRLFSYERFDIEQLELVIETALCFLCNSMGYETIETFFYVSSTVLFYRLIVSEDKLLLIFLTYKMLLLL